MLCGEKEVRHTFLVLVVVVLGSHIVGLGGCSGGNCSDGPVAFGIGVVVTDATTGSRVCDAVLTASDGTYTETLRPNGPPADCSFYGVGRAGTYDLRISRAGYVDALERNVIVAQNGCGIRSVDVNVRLAPK